MSNKFEIEMGDDGGALLRLRNVDLEFDAPSWAAFRVLMSMDARHVVVTWGDEITVELGL